MRFLIFSDTHGHVQAAMDIYKKQHQQEPVDAIIHLGDLASDARALATRLGVTVHGVNGNMDSYAKDSHKVLETEYGKVLLTHGHMENVKFGLERLMYKAEELGCKAALYGHTHVPSFVDGGGIYLLNPGSLTEPRGGTPGSYAVLSTSEKEFRASILFHSAMRPGIADKNKLRDMLNNSDRF